MDTVALVPVKRLNRAKSRLAPALSPRERASLARNMLAHVLEAIARSGAVDTIAVIGPGVDTGKWSLPHGVVPLAQSRTGLNNALEEGRQWAISHGAGALLVVFADLPLLTPEDVAAIVKLGSQPGTVVLAPDRHRRGTNALLSRPAALARFAFGPDSYSRHAALALQAGASLQTYYSQGTALDVDTPDDLSFIESLYHASGEHP